MLCASHQSQPVVQLPFGRLHFNLALISFVLEVGSPIPYVCMVWCGRPALFIMWLCKLHTIEDNVLCHATVVVSSTNLLKAKDRGVGMLYSIGESVLKESDFKMFPWASPFV